MMTGNRTGGDRAAEGGVGDSPQAPMLQSHHRPQLQETRDCMGTATQTLPKSLRKRASQKCVHQQQKADTLGSSLDSSILLRIKTAVQAVQTNCVSYCAYAPAENHGG